MYVGVHAQGQGVVKVLSSSFTELYFTLVIYLKQKPVDPGLRFGLGRRMGHGISLL